MKRSSVSSFMLKEHQAALSAMEPSRKRGISSAIFYTWRSKLGGTEVSEDERLNPLKEGNACLKRLLASWQVSTLREKPGKYF